jgi:hypothetical protein
MAAVVGQPPEGQVAHHLAGEHGAGVGADLPVGSAKLSQRIHGVEAGGHAAHAGQRAGAEEPREVRVAPEEPGAHAHEAAERQRGRGLVHGWLAHEGEGHPGQPHQGGGGQEAQAVAVRRRHPGEDPGGREAAQEAGDPGQRARDPEEAATHAAGDAAAHHVHPRRHEGAAGGGDDQQHEKEEPEGERGRRPGHHEGHSGEQQERDTLTPRPAQHEG